jgi:hypothetical protein
MPYRVNLRGKQADANTMVVQENIQEECVDAGGVIFTACYGDSYLLHESVSA